MMGIGGADGGRNWTNGVYFSGMKNSAPIVYFSKMVQAFPLMVPVQRLTGGVYVSNRASTVRSFRRKFPDLPAHRCWRVAAPLSSGWHDLRRAKVIVAGASHTSLLKSFPGRKVMIFHGCVNRLTRDVVASLASFDHVLLQSPRLERMLRRTDWNIDFSYSVPGYVAFDHFPPPSSEGRQTILSRLGLDPTRQTVVYTPTRSIYGSWCDHAEAIAREVSEEYNLVLRPHPHQVNCGNAEEKASFRTVTKLLESRRSGVIDMDGCSLGELLSVADLLISDANSTAEEALFYDVPQLFTEIYSREKWLEQYEREGLDDESIEELMGLYECGVSFPRLGVSNWNEAVVQALEKGRSLSSVRQAYFTHVFGSRTDEPAARRVADELTRMVLQT